MEQDAPGPLDASARPTGRWRASRFIAVLLLVSAVLGGCSAEPYHQSGPSHSPEPPEATERPSSAARTGIPGPENTGVPPGTQLTPYEGPCSITTPGTVIEAKIVSCDTLNISAPDVRIERSRTQRIWLDTDLPGSSAWSYVLSDSDVVVGSVVQLPAVAYGNLTVERSNIVGGQTSVQCGMRSITCEVRGSWLHGQTIPPQADWHLGGFLSNGGRNIRLIHNTIDCDPPPSEVGGGCTGNLNLLGDFAAVSDVLIDGNMLGANPVGSSYCTYGGDSTTKPFPNADHVIYRNNTFQRGSNGKCGAYGPVTGFNVNGVGNVWHNNRWDDGSPVEPAN